VRRRLLHLLAVVVDSFAVIAAAGILLAWLYAPTSSPASFVAYLGTMFAVTGATVAGVVVICCRQDQGQMVPPVGGGCVSSTEPHRDRSGGVPHQ